MIHDLGKERATFIHGLLKSDLNRIEQIVGLVWYSTRERPGMEIDLATIVTELELAGLPHQNRARLRNSLSSNRLIVRGRAPNSVRLPQPSLEALDEKYRQFVTHRKAPLIASEYLPQSILPARRPYLGALVQQINGTYEFGYYDAAAVLLRRVVESLILDIYISNRREAEIALGDGFLMLDKLISHFASDKSFSKSRDLVKALQRIKSMGDTAAHSRYYLTLKHDLDDVRFEARKVVTELGTMLPG
jgi:hypothetical protein